MCIEKKFEIFKHTMQYKNLLLYSKSYKIHFCPTFIIKRKKYANV